METIALPPEEKKKSTMPRPAVPFSFKAAVELAKGVDSSNEEEGVDSKVVVKLLALLNAKGVGFNQIVELCGEEVKETVDKGRKDKDLSRLINLYSARLNESVESRIRRATGVALDRLLDVLHNPKATPKDILSAAKDILDRELGKAKQQIEVSGFIDASSDVKELVSSTQAVEERIKALEERRAAVLRAHSKPVLEAEIIKTSEA